MKLQGAVPCPTQARYPTDGHCNPRPATSGSGCKASVARAGGNAQQTQPKQEEMQSFEACALLLSSTPSPSYSCVCSGTERRAQQRPHDEVGRSPSQSKTALAAWEKTAEWCRTAAPKVEHRSPVPAPSLGQITARADSSNDIKCVTGSCVLSGEVSRQTELCESPKSDLSFLQSSQCVLHSGY